MSERKMCHDCPHLKEHETGEEIVFFPDYPKTPHPCHNATHLPCVGHQMQQQKHRLMMATVEDYPIKRCVRTDRDSFSRKGE